MEEWEDDNATSTLLLYSTRDLDQTVPGTLWCSVDNKLVENPSKIDPKFRKRHPGRAGRGCNVAIVLRVRARVIIQRAHKNDNCAILFLFHNKLNMKMGWSNTSRSKQRPTANNVAFAPDPKLCDYYAGSLEELTPEVINELWFQAEDYEEIRHQAKKETANGKEHGADFYISRTYGYTDDKSQEMLTQWTKLRDTLRGLERFVSQDFSQARSQVRQKTVRAVLHTQHKLDKEDEKDYSRRAEAISEVATTLSREATEFAFMIGSADEKAAMFLQSRTRRSSMGRRTSIDSTASRRSSIDSSAMSSRRSSIASQASHSDSICSTVSIDISCHRRSFIPQKIEMRSTPIYSGKDIRV